MIGNPSPGDPVCATCLHYTQLRDHLPAGDPGGHGMCSRFPPQAVTVTKQIPRPLVGGTTPEVGHEWRFPRVTSETSCGEHPFIRAKLADDGDLTAWLARRGLTFLKDDETC